MSVSAVLPHGQAPAPTTLQRVLRGSWREDALWRVRDVALSEGMARDHSLDVYIAALALC